MTSGGWFGRLFVYGRLDLPVPGGDAVGPFSWCHKNDAGYDLGVYLLVAHIYQCGRRGLFAGHFWPFPGRVHGEKILPKHPSSGPLMAVQRALNHPFKQWKEMCKKKDGVTTGVTVRVTIIVKLHLVSPPHVPKMAQKSPISLDLITLFRGFRTLFRQWGVVD